MIRSGFKSNQSTISSIGLWIMLCCYYIFSASTWANSDEEPSAVILMYHHISDKTPPSTSISIEDFKAHLDYIHQHFTVLPLRQIVDALKSNTSLPDNTIAITFDDGYRNILENGHPLLSDYDFPYTVFINPERIGREYGQMSWQDVRALHQQGVEFANHTLDHIHMLNRLTGESYTQWLTRVWQNVEQAQQQIAAQLSTKDKSFEPPKYLAYPFGEYNRALADKLVAEGYVGFGQHSGAVSSSQHFGALPRFPAAGIYANLDTLKTKLHSLPMKVDMIEPVDPEITLKPAVIDLSFSLRQGLNPSQVSCFFKGEPVSLDVQGTTIMTKTQLALPVGRSRVNCTAPSPLQKGRFHWFSAPFFVANDKGKYPD